MKCEMIDVQPGPDGSGYEIECLNQAMFFFDGIPTCRQCAERCQHEDYECIEAIKGASHD